MCNNKCYIETRTALKYKHSIKSANRSVYKAFNMFDQNPIADKTCSPEHHEGRIFNKKINMYVAKEKDRQTKGGTIA